MCRKTNPVLLVDILVGVPLAGQEWVLPGDDLAVEEGRQGGELFRETLDLQVTAEIAVLLVHVLAEHKEKALTASLTPRRP